MIEHIWIFHCGHVGVPRAALESGADFGIVRMPFMGLLLEHAERGPMLVDAPFGHEGPANFGRLASTSSFDATGRSSLASNRSVSDRGMSNTSFRPTFTSITREA